MFGDLLNLLFATFTFFFACRLKLQTVVPLPLPLKKKPSNVTERHTLLNGKLMPVISLVYITRGVLQTNGMTISPGVHLYLHNFSFSRISLSS